MTVKIDFLISPGVERPADDDLGARRMQADERLGARPVLVGIGA